MCDTSPIERPDLYKDMVQNKNFELNKMMGIPYLPCTFIIKAVTSPQASSGVCVAILQHCVNLLDL